MDLFLEKYWTMASSTHMQRLFVLQKWANHLIAKVPCISLSDSHTKLIFCKRQILNICNLINTQKLCFLTSMLITYSQYYFDSMTITLATTCIFDPIFIMALCQNSIKFTCSLIWNLSPLNIRLSPSINSLQKSKIKLMSFNDHLYIPLFIF